MKGLVDFICEKREKISLNDLKRAVWSGSMMKDRSYITIDGESYYKIKPDVWEKEIMQAHAVAPTYTNQEIYDLCDNALEVNLSDMVYK